MRGQVVLDENEVAAGLLDVVEEEHKQKATNEDNSSAVTVNRPQITVTADSHSVTLWKTILPVDSVIKDGASCEPSQLAFAKPHHIWVVLLFRSGHFAAAVFQEGRCLLHKCFHRYVTFCFPY